jgi:hypothetical protein
MVQAINGIIQNRYSLLYQAILHARPLPKGGEASPQAAASSLRLRRRRLRRRLRLTLGIPTGCILLLLDRRDHLRREVIHG